MGYRFRKSIKILPGIRFNLSKSGVSATVGKPGASVNISERGTRGTVGLPGSGISYSEKLTNPAPAPTKPQTPAPGMAGNVGKVLALAALVCVAWVVLH
jgi:hypothetical protein